MIEHLLHAHATMRHDAGHIGTEKRVHHKHEGYDDHRPADHASCRLKYHDRTDQADDEVRFRIHTGTQHQLIIVDDDIKRRARADDGENHVQRIHLALRPALTRRIKQENQQKAEGQVNRALQMRVQNTEGRRIQLENSK